MTDKNSGSNPVSSCTSHLRLSVFICGKNSLLGQNLREVDRLERLLLFVREALNLH